MTSARELQETLTEARERRDRCESEMAELHQRAGGVLSAGQQDRWERLRAGRSRAVQDAEEAEDRLRRKVLDLAESGSVEPGDGNVAIDGARLGKSRDRAMRVVDQHVRSGQLPAEAGEKVEGLISKGAKPERSFASRWVRATGSDAYFGAFGKWLVDPERGHLMWSEQERSAWQTVQSLRAEQRAMSTGDSAGGYGALPFQLDPTVILTNAGTVSPLREVSRVVTTLTDKWRAVTSAGATASWDDEAEEVSDDAPPFASPEIAVHRLSAFVPFSREIEQDYGQGAVPSASLAQELSKVLLDASNRLMSQAYTVGSGVAEPKGVITAVAAAGGSVVSPTVAEQFGAPDVYATIEALPPRWRDSARWMANLSVLNDVDLMETSNGAKLFPEVGSSNPVLLRRPLHENSEMDGSWNTAATANNYILLVGDFSQNIIVDAAFSASVEVIPHLFGENQRPTGQRGAYLFLRTGSDVSTVDAFRVLNLATTA